MKITNHHSGKRGFTLAEILISTGIFAVIMTLTVALFSSSWKHFQVANTRNDAEINAIRGIDRFYRDLVETKKGSIRCDNVTHVYYFLSARTEDGQFHSKPDGTSDWQGWMYYYLFPDTRTPPFNGQSFYFLARKYFSFSANPASPPSVGKDNINGARIMARCITDFTVNDEYLSGGTGHCIRIKSMKDYGGRECSFELERFVTLEDLP